MDETKAPQPDPQDPPNPPRPAVPPKLPKEIGGAKGPEPTRYGDWQHKGRVTDF
jgi:homeobox protein ESX1